jgi:putative sigma-54 modulation protein
MNGATAKAPALCSYQRGNREGVESVQIKISARHGHLSEPTQAFIREKAQKLLRFFERLTSIEVTVDLKDEVNKLVEILASAEHKHDFVASESHPDILAAVDLVVDKLEAQLRRYKEKVQDRRRRPSAGEVAGSPASEESSEE